MFDPVEETLRSIRAVLRFVLALSGAMFLIALLAQRANDYAGAATQVRRLGHIVHRVLEVRDELRWSIGGATSANVIRPNSLPVRLDQLPATANEAAISSWFAIADSLSGVKPLCWNPKAESVAEAIGDKGFAADVLVDQATAEVIWKELPEFGMNPPQGAVRLAGVLNVKHVRGEEFSGNEFVAAGHIEELPAFPTFETTALLPVLSEVRYLSLEGAEAYLTERATADSRTSISLFGQAVPSEVVLIAAPIIEAGLCLYLLMLIQHLRILGNDHDVKLLHCFPYPGAFHRPWRWITCIVAIFAIPAAGQIAMMITAPKPSTIVVASIIGASAIAATTSIVLARLPSTIQNTSREAPAEV